MHERFALNDGLREWITRRSRMDTRPQGQFIAMLPLCMARRRELDETRRHTSARIAANSVINSDRENERWKGGSRRKKIASIFYCSLFLYTLYTIIRRAETYGDRRDGREYLWNNRSPWDEVLFLASKLSTRVWRPNKSVKKSSEYPPLFRAIRWSSDKNVFLFKYIQNSPEQSSVFRRRLSRNLSFVFSFAQWR